MTSFASENAYQTLDNATTDDELATLLTAPEFSAVEDVAVNVLEVDEPPINLGELLDVDNPPATLLTAPELPAVADVAVAVNVLDVNEPPIDLGVDEPPIDLGIDGSSIDLRDGNVISMALQRLDEKWTNILTTYNADLDEKHAFDVKQRRYDEENCDDQRRRDREEQRLINAELRTMKRMELEVFLVSLKDAFATEMKATFDGFRSELSTWKTSINDSMATNTTTLQAEIKAAINTPAATSLKATIDGLMVTVPTFMQEMRATVSALSDTVKSLEDRVIRSQGQFTKTTLPTLRSRLDLLEGRTTQVPQVFVEEPPPAHPPESTVPPPPAVSVLPVVLPLDPPDDSVALPPRVPERVHHVGVNIVMVCPWTNHILARNLLLKVEADLS
jgi:hypothetical protein